MGRHKPPDASSGREALRRAQPKIFPEKAETPGDR
jgi:hypothetical protein